MIAWDPVMQNAVMVGTEVSAARPPREQTGSVTSEGQKQKRHLRERQSTNYNEDFIEFDSIELDDRPFKRSKFAHERTVPSISASHLELETAWAVVVNAGESILDEEEDLLPAGAHEQVYVQVRNIVVSKWREDVSRHLSEKDAVAAVGWAHRPYAIAAWRFLHQTGFINYGVAPGVSGRQEPEQNPKGTVVVVGAGMAGLATARQLQAKGHRVIIVEGHGRPGGRVYSKQLKKGKVSAVADLGGSILTGIDGNPLAVIAKQLHIPLHVIDEANVPLYQDDGQQAHTQLDQEVEKRWNDVLDECSKYRDAMGEVTDNISLGTALESLWATAEASAPAAAKKRGRKKKASPSAAEDLITADSASAEATADAVAVRPDAQAASGTQHTKTTETNAGSADAQPSGLVAQPSAPLAATSSQLMAEGLPNGVSIERHSEQTLAQPKTAGPGMLADNQRTAAPAINCPPSLPLLKDLVAAAAKPQEHPRPTEQDCHKASAAADSSSKSDIGNKHLSSSNADGNTLLLHSASGASVPTDSGMSSPGLDKQASLDSHQTNLELSTLDAASNMLSQPPALPSLPLVPDSTQMPAQDLPGSPAAAPTGAVLSGQRGGAVSRLQPPDNDQASDSSMLDIHGCFQPNSSLAGTSEQSKQDARQATAAAAAVSDSVQAPSAEDVMISPDMQKLKRQLLDWHMANLEFANAAMLGALSMRSWDQDDPFEIQGSHCFLPGCNIRLVQALAKGLPIMYNNVVKRISYDQTGVQVTAGNTVIAADAVVVTVPLGVLKKNNIQFEPALPERKLQAIRRLGFGVLNKVVLLFEEDFWGSTDMFGRLAPSTVERGKFFLFYSYTGISGGPLLAALVSGEAAEDIEKIPAQQAVAEALSVLRGIFEPKGIHVPIPLQACCTRWGQDPMAYGSYSSVGVGSVGSEDYDIMAESVGERVFFAGEATTRKFPATMHGAFFSGLREAANVDATLTRLRQQLKRKRDVELARANVLSVKTEDGQDPDFKPDKHAAGQAAEEVQQLAAQLTQVFDNDDAPPDAEFGCFQVVYGPPDSDLTEEALLKLDVGSIRGRGAPRRSLPVFLSLSRSNAQRLQDLPGGDEARVNFLTTALGLQMVGRAGLTAPQKALVKAVLARRPAPHPLPGPPPRLNQTQATITAAHPQRSNTLTAQQPAAQQQPGRLPQYVGKASTGYMRPQYSAPKYQAPYHSTPANASWQAWSAPAPAHQYPSYARDANVYPGQSNSNPYGQAGVVPDAAAPRRQSYASHLQGAQQFSQPTRSAWPASNQHQGLAGQPHDRHKNFGAGQLNQQLHSGYSAAATGGKQSYANGHHR